MEFLIWGVEPNTDRIIYLAIASDPVPRRVAVAREYAGTGRQLQFVSGGGRVGRGTTDEAFAACIERFDLVEIDQRSIETHGMADFVEFLKSRYATESQQQQPQTEAKSAAAPTVRITLPTPQRQPAPRKYPFSLN